MCVCVFVCVLQVNIEYVPVLLGALFKAIGQSIVSVCTVLSFPLYSPSLSLFLSFLQIPIINMTPQKQSYLKADMMDWCDYSGTTITWPDVFPIHSVLPLRVTLASHCDPNLIRTLCEQLCTTCKTYPFIMVKHSRVSLYNDLCILLSLTHFKLRPIHVNDK